MVFKNELYPIHFYGRVRGECDGRLQNWPGIVNERPKFLAMPVIRESFFFNVNIFVQVTIDTKDLHNYAPNFSIFTAESRVLHVPYSNYTTMRT